MKAMVLTGLLIGAAIGVLIVVNQLNNSCSGGLLQYKMTAAGEACESPKTLQDSGAKTGS